MKELLFGCFTIKERKRKHREVYDRDHWVFMTPILDYSFVGMVLLNTICVHDGIVTNPHTPVRSIAEATTRSALAAYASLSAIVSLQLTLLFSQYRFSSQTRQDDSTSL